MSREKTERLLNLTMALLGTRNYLSKSQILRTVAGYEGSPEALDRMFERDKDDLREMGIPIEVRTVDPLFDDEPGYRIDRRAYQLPALSFTAQEMGWLTVAAQAWQRAALAGPAAEGLRKLIATGAEPDADAITSFAASMATPDPAFSALFDAVTDQRSARFAYRSAGDTHARERAVDPWGLLSTTGRWYLVGRDHEADQVRVFRLSRISGAVTVGPAGTFVVPDDVDLWSHVALLDVPQHFRQTATLRIHPGKAHSLRRRADQVISVDDQWDEATIGITDTTLAAREIAAMGNAVVVLQPTELRDRVIELLTAVGDLHG